MDWPSAAKSWGLIGYVLACRWPPDLQREQSSCSVGQPPLTPRSAGVPWQEPEGLQEEESHRLLAAVSGKLSVLQQMLPRLLHAGHRLLIFSQSTEVRTPT